MHAEAILNEYADRAGWDESSMLFICLEYIDNQQSNDAFEDFVRRQCEEEESESDETLQ